MPKQTSKHKKLYTVGEFSKVQKKPENTNIFSFNLIQEESVGEIIDALINKDYEHFSIDPTNDLLTKFLAGDRSDKIPRVHPKMTPSKVNKVIASFLTNEANIIQRIDSGDSVIINQLNELVCESLKIKEPSEKEMTLTNVKRNIKLIRLNTNVFPIHISNWISSNCLASTIKRFDYLNFKKTYLKK